MKRVPIQCWLPQSPAFIGGGDRYFPAAGKGFANGVWSNFMRASTLSTSGIPQGVAIEHLANSNRVVYAELATFLLARDALVELTGSIA